MLQNARTEAVKAGSVLRLPFRTRAWRGQAGGFTGSGIGSSLDFQDHRSYMPGDDPRHINWQAYARTGSYTMKLFREEVRPVVDLIVDCSDSMFFEETKACRTAGLLHFLVESCAAAGAGISVQALRGDACTQIDPAVIQNQTWLDTVRALPAADPTRIPAVEKTAVRGGSIRVFLSDLLFPGDPEPVLRHLSQRHGTVIFLAPFLDAEARPDWDGNVEFIDAESHTRHPHRIGPEVLRRYLESYATHFQVWKQSAVRHAAALARISCEGDLTAVLFRDAVPAGALETIHA